MLKPFKTIRLNEVDESLFQDNASNFCAQLSAQPQLDAVILKDIAIVSGGDTPIPHTLGRKWVGWHLVNIDSNATVWAPDATNKELFLTLRPSANCIISILVF